MKAFFHTFFHIYQLDIKAGRTVAIRQAMAETGLDKRSVEEIIFHPSEVAKARRRMAGSHLNGWQEKKTGERIAFSNTKDSLNHNGWE